MGLFLKIPGILFLALIATIVGVILHVRWRLRRLFGQLAEVAGSMGPPPLELDLQPIVGDIVWRDEQQVMVLVGRLSAQGFHSLGAFQVEAAGQLQVEGWADASRSLTAAIYQHSAVDRPWIDYVREYEGRRADTASNASGIAEIDPKPGNFRLIDPSLCPVELLAHLLCTARALPVRPAPSTAYEFKERFEAYHADEMEWHAARGGLTEEETRKIAALSGDNHNEELINAALKHYRGWSTGAMAELLTERFRRSTKMSVSEWSRFEGSLFFVHDNLTPGELNQLVDERLYDPPDDDRNDDEIGLLDESDPTPARAAFAAYNSTLPATVRFIKLGELAEPIAADVYRTPFGLMQ